MQRRIRIVDGRLTGDEQVAASGVGS